MADARAAALKILTKIEKDGAYSNLELQHSDLLRNLEPRDTAFAIRLVYGVTERRNTLDHYILQNCNRKLNQLSLPVLLILRMAVYQICYMDRVPDSAAVNEAVKLARRSCKSACGFVNGVLRSLLRQGTELRFSENMTEQARISVQYSVHPNLAKLLIDTYSSTEAIAFLEASFDRPPVFLRVNSMRTTASALIDRLRDEGFCAEISPEIPDCLELAESGEIHQSQSYREGLFHVQDLASQYCCRILDPQPGERILDVCAAPGGKTFTAAQRMKNEGEIVSCDLHPHRVELIRHGAGRLGLSCVVPTVRDASGRDAETGTFDRVLCDVPCSGFGVIRRKPEIRYHDPDGFSDLITLQRTILESACEQVRPGGVLVYSTCTVNSAENGEQVSAFLHRHPEFEPVPLWEGAGLTQKTFFPQHDRSDGFFAAKLKRKK